MWRNRTIANGPAEERVRDRSLLGDAVGSPSLDLNFAGGTLDPRITFTRSTVGTYYRGQFNQNLLLRSQEFDNTTTWATVTAGTGVAPVRTANNAVAPDGTTTADTLTFNTGVGTTASDQSLILQSITFTTGRQYTLSFWVRGTVGGEKLTVRQLGAAAYTLVTATTSWQRISVTETATIGGNIQIGIRQSISGHGVINSTATVEIWGAQLTEGSLLTPYIPTTTAAITQGQIASSQPWNLFLQSQAFDVSPWVSAVTGAGVNPVVTANADVAPDGTTTADRIDFNCGGLTVSDRCIRRQAISLSATTYTVSVWARSATGTTQHIQFHQDGGTSATTFAVGTSWQRLTWTYTSVGGSLNTGLELRGNNTAGVTTSSIYVWGMQLNEGTSALDYSPTTTVANWLPRFENDPVTGEARGLLIEGGATNLCLQSADLATTWTNDNTTEGANAITAPDGTISADSLIDTATTSTHGIFQGISGQSTTATYTLSAFLKKGTVRYVCLFNNMAGSSQWGVCVDMDNPTQANLVTGAVGAGNSVSGATITNVGNGWYRVSVTGVCALTTHYPAITHRSTVYSGTGALTESYAGAVTNLTYLWGFQYEQQAFASSYIPTVAATVARGVDVAVMTGTNFSDWYNQSEGTVLCDQVGYPLGVGAARSWQIDDGTQTERHLGVGSGITSMLYNCICTDNSSTQASMTMPTAINGLLPFKNAYAYKQNDFAMTVNQLPVVTDSAGTIPLVNRLNIGSGGGSVATVNTAIRRIAYWPTRFPNATLQSLTT